MFWHVMRSCVEDMRKGEPGLGGVGKSEGWMRGRMEGRHVSMVESLLALGFIILSSECLIFFL